MVLHDDVSYRAFLDFHKPQLQANSIPEHFWYSLYSKLNDELFDAGTVLSLIRIEYDDADKAEEDPNWALQVTAPEGLKAEDPNQIYLVDHAWTYELDSAKSMLRANLALLDRMSAMMGVDSGLGVEDRVALVYRSMWRHNLSYSVRLGDDDSNVPLWYIMDEVGSAVVHSDEPNFKAVAFFYAKEQRVYTAMFPLRDLDCEEIISRDFFPGVADQERREALLLPWKTASLAHKEFAQTEPDESYFLHGHEEESLPVKSSVNPPGAKATVLKVYSEYSLIKEYLEHPSFEIVENESEADVLWYTEHFKHFEQLSEASPEKFINQFPFEHVITIKDLLAAVCRRKAKRPVDRDSLETFPEWLPTTYNLETELVQFISYYQNRQKLGMDNHWICKPWNLARGMDTHITDDLVQILRLSSSCPKIAQKYIEKPVLYERPECGGQVKFDIRYVVLLMGTQPLKLCVYRNFFLRFANKPFELRNFDDYETHFTVMNYKESVQLCHLHCDDFLLEFEKQHPNHRWADVERRIFAMLRDTFEAATESPPPKGIANNPQSRAVYAADLMLAWTKDAEMQPKLLEINWTPDCQRACNYYPDFYDKIFPALFLDDVCPEAFAVL